MQNVPRPGRGKLNSIWGAATTAAVNAINTTNTKSNKTYTNYSSSTVREMKIIHVALV